MNDLIKKLRKMSAEVNRTNEKGLNTYRIISDFGKSSVISEPGYFEKYFRIFTPVSSFKGRKLNSLYGEKFNPFKDTLMDYPTIVQYKLDKVGTLEWKYFNRLISLHVSRCPLNCWHCYLEECLKSDCNFCGVQDLCNRKLKIQTDIKEGWFTSREIVEGFMKQCESDKERGLYSNILRITGGEPFLVPELFMEILEELKKRNLNKSIFLWTETNLLPFIIPKDGKAIVTEEHLLRLSEHKNFCIYPCFHGLNEDNFREVTGQTIGTFEYLTDALKRLVDAHIDIYPTFGSNITSPSNVEPFYERISRINELMPLRFCLIEYDLDYKPIRWRREKVPGFAKEHERVYDRFQVIEKWDGLLRKRTGFKYGDIPRHLVPLIGR
jgi:uncharacterized Fe-S cluster-containing radical SAM superfamily protein